MEMAERDALRQHSPSRCSFSPRRFDRPGADAYRWSARSFRRAASGDRPAGNAYHRVQPIEGAARPECSVNPARSLGRGIGKPSS